MEDRLWGCGEVGAQTGRGSCSGSAKRGGGPESGTQQWGREKWPHSGQVSLTCVCVCVCVTGIPQSFLQWKRRMGGPCWMCQGLSLISVNNYPDGTSLHPQHGVQNSTSVRTSDSPYPRALPRSQSHLEPQMVLGKLDAHVQKDKVGPLPYTTHKN